MNGIWSRNWNKWIGHMMSTVSNSDSVEKPMLANYRILFSRLRENFCKWICNRNLIDGRNYIKITTKANSPGCVTKSGSGLFLFFANQGVLGKVNFETFRNFLWVVMLGKFAVLWLRLFSTNISGDLKIFGTADRTMLFGHTLPFQIPPIKTA